MAGFVRRSQDQSLPDTPLVFLHSGGLPALFTARYRDWFKLPQLLL
jgi:1-aminocyclopropane-1-carboxylate deaminase/D-cysteine desulfhydrase-like pyridoxal-dependent ACC family enzyme